MKPISKEIRKLVVDAKKDGKPIIEIVSMLKISESTVYTIWRLFKTTGSVEAKAYKGRKSRLTDEMIAAIQDKIKDEPDATLEEIVTDLNLPIKKSQLSKLLRKHNYSLKKNSTCSK